MFSAMLLLIFILRSTTTVMLAFILSVPLILVWLLTQTEKTVKILLLILY